MKKILKNLTIKNKSMKSLLRILLICLIPLIGNAQTYTHNTRVKLKKFSNPSANDSIVTVNSRYQLGFIKKSDLIKEETPQTLSINDQIISISDGNSITLPSISQYLIESGNGLRIDYPNNTNSYGPTGLNALDLSTGSRFNSVSGATGFRSLAFGEGSIASGSQSISLKQGTASGNDSMNLSGNGIAAGLQSLSIQAVNRANGDYSIAGGLANTSPSYGEIVLGPWATEILTGNATTWNSSDRLFSLGNGSSSSTRNNAITIFKSGEFLVPMTDISDITNPKSIITKEYFDANSSNSPNILARNGVEIDGVTNEIILGGDIEDNTDLEIINNSTFEISGQTSNTETFSNPITGNQTITTTNLNKFIVNNKETVIESNVDSNGEVTNFKFVVSGNNAEEEEGDGTGSGINSLVTANSGERNLTSINSGGFSVNLSGYQPGRFTTFRTSANNFNYSIKDNTNNGISEIDIDDNRIALTHRDENVVAPPKTFVGVGDDVFIKPVNSSNNGSQLGYVLTKKDNNDAVEWSPIPSSQVKTAVVEIPDTPDTPGSSNYTVNHNLNVSSYISVDILLVKTFPFDAFGAEDYKIGASERTQESAGFMTLNSNSLEMGGYDFSSTPNEKLIITYIE